MVNEYFFKIHNMNLKTHHAIERVVVIMCGKFQTASTCESEDRQVTSLTQSHTNLSYLAPVPNRRKS